MHQDGESRLRRLEDAIEAWLARDPAVPEDSFLAANEPLRDLLAPMLDGDAEADGDRDESGQPQIGDLALGREIGRGGMGIVYEAEDRRLKRRVAVKLMRRSPATSPSSIVRFWREAELAAALHHPGVVPVHSLGETEDLFYLVMRLEEAASLSAVLQELAGTDPARLDALSLGAATAAAVAQRFPGSTAVPRPVASHVHAAVELVAQVAEALGHAHAHGIVHRDVKPGNILVDAAGRAFLTDFGLACVHGEPGVTRTGEAPGTPNYMAPEQARGQRGEVGPPADVFALGATLYELLTLRRAFDGDSVPSVLFDVVHREPVDPRRLCPALPRDVAAVVLRALDKDPRRRYPDGAAMAADLRAFLRGDPVTARPPTRWQRLRRFAAREPWRALAAVLLLIGLPVAVFAWQAMRRQPQAEVGERVLRREWLDAQLAHGFRETGEGDSESARGYFDAILFEFPGAEEGIAGLSVDARRRGDRAALEVLAAAPQALATSAALRRRQAALLRRLLRTEEAVLAETGLPAPDGFDAFLDGYGHVELGHRGAKGEFELAKQALHRAIVTSDRPRPLFYFEWLHAAAHARDEAAIDEGIAAIGRLWPDDAGSWFWIAFAENERGRTDAAADALHRAVTLAPDFLAALVNRARLLRRTGHNAEAIAVLQAALPRAAHAAFVHRELGTSLLMARQFAPALASYEAAAPVYGADPTFRREHASVLVEADQVQSGYAILQQLVVQQPDDHEVRLCLASAEMKRGQPRAAMEQVQRSIAIHPTAQAQYLLGVLQAQAGETAAARLAYEQAMALDPGEVRAPVNLALLYLREGEAAPAEDLLRRALAVDPAFLPARRALLRILDERPADAVAMCRDWLLRAPDLPEAQRHLAWSLLRTGSAELRGEALVLAQRASAATAGKDGPTLHVLGAAQLANGDAAAAESTLQRALLALDPDDRFSAYYRQRIEASLQECRRAQEHK